MSGEFCLCEFCAKTTEGVGSKELTTTLTGLRNQIQIVEAESDREIAAIRDGMLQRQSPRMARIEARSDPMVASTADGSYPQCAMQFAHRGSLPRP